MRMMRNVLLAGASASGKSTLARALGRTVVSTSGRLRWLLSERYPGANMQNPTSEFLYKFGREMDQAVPHWMEGDALEAAGRGVVVDAIRSEEQYRVWQEYTPLQEVAGGVNNHNLRMRTSCVRVNVVCGSAELDRRHDARGTLAPGYPVFMFDQSEADFTWHSDRVPLAQAVQVVRRLQGGGYADIVLGAQYGSEGKGKLCALLAPGYDILVRSGGPNAGHWVRDVAEMAEGGRAEKGAGVMYCFHSLPSGSLHNPKARLMIAAGAAVEPDSFMKEVRDVFRLRGMLTGENFPDGWTWGRNQLLMDYHVMTIRQGDKDVEKGLVAAIGSTGQGVGEALLRRISRERKPSQVRDLSHCYGNVAGTLQDEMASGARVMLEGTQGSGLSLFHGPYPYVTSRDTNAAGLLSETGVAPSWVRDVWLVVRSLPIRTGGNSGPFGREELSWDEVEDRLGLDRGKLSSREMTSTTHRLRRVAEFDPVQFKEACMTNAPTRLFLTFADYIDRRAQGVRRWKELPQPVLDFVTMLETLANCPVAGVSTGCYNHEVAWRPGYEPRVEGELR